MYKKEKAIVKKIKIKHHPCGKPNLYHRISWPIR